MPQYKKSNHAVKMRKRLVKFTFFRFIENETIEQKENYITNESIIICRIKCVKKVTDM